MGTTHGALQRLKQDSYFHHILYKIDIYINFILERPRQSVHNQTYMGDIFLTGIANITKLYIYIQLIKVGNKSIMNKEHDASHFSSDKRRQSCELQQVK